jgi:hypothetical protein
LAFSIPSGIINQYQEVVDAIINDLGKDITLVYPPKQVACTNCVADTIGNKPGSHYITGMPIPTFKTVGCEQCGGTGYRAQEATEVIRANLYWAPKDFIKLIPGVDIPNGAVAMRSFLHQLPKLERCDTILAHNGLVGYGMIRLRRTKDYIPQGLGIDRYVWTFWTRIN